MNETARNFHLTSNTDCSQHYIGHEWRELENVQFTRTKNKGSANDFEIQTNLLMLYVIGNEGDAVDAEKNVSYNCIASLSSIIKIKYNR